MKKRYCEVEKENGKVVASCDAAWGYMGTKGYKSCHDLPIEVNCHYLVEVPDSTDAANPPALVVKTLVTGDGNPPGLTAEETKEFMMHVNEIIRLFNKSQGK